MLNNGVAVGKEALITTGPRLSVQVFAAAQVRNRYGAEASVIPLYFLSRCFLVRMRCVHGARALPAALAPRFQDDTTSSKSAQATPVVRVREL